MELERVVEGDIELDRAPPEPTMKSERAQARHDANDGCSQAFGRCEKVRVAVGATGCDMRGVQSIPPGGGPAAYGDAPRKFWPWRDQSLNVPREPGGTTVAM